MKKSTQTSLALAIFAIALAGCGKKAPAELPPPPAGTQATGERAPTPPPAAPVRPTVVPGSQQDFLANVSSDRIFFDFDQYNIDESDRRTLESHAQWLRRHSSVHVTIEGHADERGTRDYNLALGERRANAAKNYLITLGIDAARIHVISYGKERPAVTGSNEDAWAQNRRAVTVVVESRR